MSARTFLPVFAAVTALGSPVPGFRPPAVPLLSQSPLVNVFSMGDLLNGDAPQQWTHNSVDMFAAVAVDGSSYLLMGSPTPAWSKQALSTATQVGFAVVMATQTRYAFTAGPVAINLTFTSPQIASDYDLMSRPAHYVTFDVAATDGASHAVSFYFDVSPRLVMTDGTALVSFSRVPLTGAEALSVGATNQQPLSSTSDRAQWGIAYLIRDTSVPNAAVLRNLAETRPAFMTMGKLPTGGDDPVNPQPLSNSTAPATGPQPGVDRGGGDMPGSPFVIASADPNLCWAACNSTAGCKAWAYAIPACDGFAKPTCWLKDDYGTPTAQKCRVSGAQAGAPMPGDPSIVAAITYDIANVGAAGASRVVTVAVDEILGISWFGELMPPYWRRALPIGNASVIPTAMLNLAFQSYESVKALCDDFDATTAVDLSAVGGDEYATVAQLTYRQVWAGQMLVWSPTRNTMWYFLKEISSCGCLQTADVIYPAFPQVLYYAPELARLWMVTHLEYAMNLTSEPYPLAWAPHHLGYWPLANLPYDKQENMPLEETAWDLLIIAAIAQRQGGDLTWLVPYWPAISTWYNFLVTLLPFPQTQLSTGESCERAPPPPPLSANDLCNINNLSIAGISQCQ